MKKRQFNICLEFLSFYHKLTYFMLKILLPLVIISSLCLFSYLYCNRNLLPIGKKFETIVGLFILYTAIIYNLINYKISHEQFFKSLFSDFNNRFNNMNEDLNSIRNNEYKSKKSKKSNNKRKKEDVITDYLNFCSEEYLWFKKGRIEPNVWKSWCIGMSHYFNHQTFKEVLDKQRNEKESYYGLYDLIDYKIIRL